MKLISDRYRELAVCLWGEAILGRIEHTNKGLISRALETLSVASAGDIPRHIQILGQFPGALTAIETSLKPHIEILRAIAQQFASFDADIFTYFFAQYYAQAGYCGTSLKIAPITEHNFDEPFERLDPYFRAWGDGHTNTETLVGAAAARIQPKLSSIYLPQYQMGILKILPYTPLSLDALRQEKKEHAFIKSKLIMLDDEQNSTDHFSEVISATPIGQRNRLIADIVSFFAMLAHSSLLEDVDNLTRAEGMPVFKMVLGQLAPKALQHFEMEVEARTQDDIRDLWKTWLNNLPIEAQPQFQPTHIHLLCMGSNDWNQEAVEAAAILCKIARMMYKQVLT